MKTRKASLAVAVCVGSLTTGGNALAAYEWWPMMMNCWQDVDASTYFDPGNWASNAYGYANLVDVQSATLELYCHQPNIVANAGHDGGVAYVYDRHSSQNVVVSLCRNNGAGSQLCETKATSGEAPGYKTITFAATADTRGYFYWWVSIPPKPSSTGGVSHLGALLLKDN